MFRFFACDLATPEPDIYSKSFTDTVEFFKKSDVKDSFLSSVSPTERPAWVASLVPLIENAQREVEKKAGEWARMNQDVSSYSLFLNSCQTALGVLKSRQ